MLIGSSASAATLAKGINFISKAGLISLMMLQFSCLNPELEHEGELSVSEVAACGEFCKKNDFEMFSGKKIHLEIEASGEPAQVFYNVDPSSLPAGLFLSPSIQISGSANGALEYLKLDEKDDRENLSAFADIIAIPIANKISFLSPRIPTIKTKLSSDQSYSLSLQSHLQYALILNPSGLYHRAPIFLQSDNLTQNTNLNFEVSKEAFKLSGKISSSDTNILATFQIPQIQASVMQGNRLVSSRESVKTDGTLSLELSHSFLTDPSDVPLMLLIEPEDIENALPRIKVKLDKNLLGSKIDVGNIDLGKLKQPFAAEIEIIGSDQSSIGNATIFMKANVGNGTSLVKKQVDSSGTTLFNQLYEGIYDIAVIPPFDSPFAMKLIKNAEFLANGENGKIIIQLSRRELLHGTLMDDKNAKVNGAQIELSRIGKIGDFATEDIFDDMLFKLTATTNEEGRICQRRFGFATSNQDDCTPLTLDEGRYLAHITPPPGSKLAHHWLTFDFPKTSTLEIKLEVPQILMGKILAADKISPIKRAFVTVYLAENNLHNQPKVIANAITDDSGNFRAFISAD